MRSLRLISALGFGLGLVVTAAVAAPTPVAKDDTKLALCGPPTATSCVAKGYLDAPCNSQHFAACKEFTDAALKAHYEATDAPKLKMLRPGKTQMPADVDQGKYFAYAPKGDFAKIRKQRVKTYRKASDVLRAQAHMTAVELPPVDRVTTVDPDAAAQAHRNPAWLANGATVTSCEEFAYERSHDLARFVDAASACRGDRECVFDVAYRPATPGIANRPLVDTGGAALPNETRPGEAWLRTGRFPKNDMFALGDEFVGSNGLGKKKMLSKAMADLKRDMATGHQYYEIEPCGGSCNTTRKFADVWDWHQRLHDLTADVSEAEAEEYERRRAEFRALLEQWAAAVDKENDVLLGHEQPAVVMPFDMRTQDPFERYEHEQRVLERARVQRNAVKQRFGAEILEKSFEDAVKQVEAGAQGSRPRRGPSPIGMLAAPMPQAAGGNQPTLPGPRPTAKPSGAGSGGGAGGTKPTAAGNDTPTAAGGRRPTAKPAAPKASPCLRADGWGLEMSFQGKISCRIGEFLRHEYERKLAGQKSCLDLSNPGCDWSRDMFDADILADVPSLDRQLRDLSYCKAWKDGATFNNATSVAIVQQRLKDAETAFKEIWPLVKEYDRGTTSNGRRFGKDWESADYLGDKDWFAAGYDYDVGWEVAALEQSDAVVCKLGGSVHAEAGFDAWIVGGKVEVVDGSVWAKAMPNNNGEPSFKAHLEMFDQSVFTTDTDDAGDAANWVSAKTFSDEPAFSMGIQVPSFKPRFDIYVGVPISGQLWGELMFTSTIGMSGKVSTSCDTTSPQFAVKANYTPGFSAHGLGQVGIGIAGVASAGIRAALTLVSIELPIDVGMKVATKGDQQVLSFDSELSLRLATLAGRVSLYIEFLMYDEEWELFRWKGFGPAKVRLMPNLTVDVPLSGMK